MPEIQNMEHALVKLHDVTEYTAYKGFQYLYCYIIYGSLQSHAQTPFGKTDSKD